MDGLHKFRQLADELFGQEVFSGNQSKTDVSAKQRGKSISGRAISFYEQTQALEIGKPRLRGGREGGREGGRKEGRKEGKKERKKERRREGRKEGGKKGRKGGRKEGRKERRKERGKGGREEESQPLNPCFSIRGHN